MNLRGVFPAIVTPFSETGAIDYEVFTSIMQHQLNAGVDGFFVGGSCGEGMMLTVDERKSLLSHVIKNLPDEKKLIVHVSAFHPQDSIALIQHANDLNVDAVAILPPGYYSPLDDKAVYQYYEWLSAESVVPVMIYHLPGYSHFTISPDLFNRLVQLPNVAGIKDSSGNVMNVFKALQSPSKPVVLNGSDETIITSLANGANGLISCPANIMPERFTALFQAFKGNNLEEAIRHQQWINLVICQISKHPFLSAIKQVMCWQGNNVGTPRRPSRPLTLDEQENLRIDLEQIGFAF